MVLETLSDKTTSGVRHLCPKYLNKLTLNWAQPDISSIHIRFPDAHPGKCDTRSGLGAGNPASIRIYVGTVV